MQCIWAVLGLGLSWNLFMWAQVHHIGRRKYVPTFNCWLDKWWSLTASKTSWGESSLLLCAPRLRRRRLVSSHWISHTTDTAGILSITNHSIKIYSQRRHLDDKYRSSQARWGELSLNCLRPEVRTNQATLKCEDHILKSFFFLRKKAFLWRLVVYHHTVLFPTMPRIDVIV